MRGYLHSFTLFYFIIFLPFSGLESNEKTNFVSDKLFKYGSERGWGCMEKGSRFSAGEKGEFYIWVVKNVISNKTQKLLLDYIRNHKNCFMVLLSKVKWGEKRKLLYPSSKRKRFSPGWPQFYEKRKLFPSLCHQKATWVIYVISMKFSVLDLFFLRANKRRALCKYCQTSGWNVDRNSNMDEHKSLRNKFFGISICITNDVR